METAERTPSELRVAAALDRTERRTAEAVEDTQEEIKCLKQEVADQKETIKAVCKEIADTKCVVDRLEEAKE